MKLSKRIAALLLAAVLVLAAFAGCGGEDSKGSAPSSGTPASTPESKPESTPVSTADDGEVHPMRIAYSVGFLCGKA